MFRWRCETRRHLPWFATHWQFALAEMGYINCPMMECNYISLSESDMISHHSRCDGVSMSVMEMYEQCRGMLCMAIHIVLKVYLHKLRWNLYLWFLHLRFLPHFVFISVVLAKAPFS
jgi:hypothetical protein